MPNFLNDYVLFGMSNRHLAGLAVAGDPQQGGAGFQEEVAGQGGGVFAFQACTQLAAQAVAGVHEWGRGVGGGAGFEGWYDVGHTVVAVELLGQVVGDVVGGL